jgi:hypothetical protein
VSAALSAIANTTEQITFSAVPARGPTSSVSTVAQAVVAENRSLAVDMATTSLSTNYGVPVQYTIFITNTGNAVEQATVSTSQEITKFASLVLPDPNVTLQPGQAVSRTVAVTPLRPITQGFMKRLVEDAGQKIRMTSSDVSLFGVVTNPSDSTVISVSSGIISTTRVVTTTSMLYGAPSTALSASLAGANSGASATLAKASVAGKDNSLISWLTERVRSVLGAGVDAVGKAVAWAGAPVANASPFQAPASYSYAGGTPHSRNKTTCAYCHETHGAREGSSSTGASKLLLAGSSSRSDAGDQSLVVRPLCNTCHSGAGSKYEVEAGTVTVSGTVTDTLAGPFKDPSLGYTWPFATGDKFSYIAYPDLLTKTVDFVPASPITTSVQISATIATSSTHGVETYQKPMYSTAAVGADNFVCTKCHDQHGGTINPRMLRQNITFGGISTPVNFNWTYDTSSLPERVTPTSGSTQLCTACHDDAQSLKHSGQHGGASYAFPASMSDQVYASFSTNGGGLAPTTQFPAEYDSATSQYRNMVCLTCHKSHGTGNSPGSSPRDLPLGREEYARWEANTGFTWCSVCHGVY